MDSTRDHDHTGEPEPVAVPPFEESPSATGVGTTTGDEAGDQQRDDKETDPSLDASRGGP